MTAQTSQHQPDSERSVSPTNAQAQYPRDNWWGEDGEDVAPEDRANETRSHEDDDTERDWGQNHCFKPGSDRYKTVAFKLLRETATITCGRSRKNGLTIELTEPSIYPPTPTVRDQRHRKRYNPENGLISAGEGTWVYIEDRPLGQLLGVVEDAIDIYRPLDRYAEAARIHCRRAKKNPEGPHDVTIMTTVAKLLAQEIDLEDVGLEEAVSA